MLSKELAPALTPLRLDDKDTTVNRVDDSVSTGESVVAPCTRVPERIAATRLDIIRRVHVKVSNLLDLGAVWVAVDGANVEDAETGLVV
jgi:hypothetical protein